MSNLLIYKNPSTFDRLDELGIDYTDTLTAYQIGFLGNTGMGIDRTVPSIFNLTPCPIPSYLTTKSFSDIVYERATDLKNQGYQDVLVSGLSSLVVVKALEDVGARPHVIITDNDIQTLPEVYERIKHLSHDIVPLSELMNGNILKTKVITGSGGKYLYNVSNNYWLSNFPGIDMGKNVIPFNLSVIVFNAMNMGIWYKNRFKSSAMAKYYSNKEVAFRNIEEYLQGLMSRSPIEIKTKYDFYWWISFVMKWYSIRYRFIGITGNFVNTESFFDTPDFQSWSIANHYTKSRKVFSDFIGQDIELKSSNVVRYYTNNVTWKICWADSDGQMVPESISPTIDQVRSVLSNQS